MIALKPIPRRLLPDTAIVRVPDGEGGYERGRTIVGVRFERKRSSVDEPHRSADAGSGTVYIDAVNTAGAFEVPPRKPHRDTRAFALRGGGEGVRGRGRANTPLGVERSMSWTDDYHEAGGSIADAVATMLQDATLTSVLTKLSDSASVPEPTVLRTVGYERDETASSDERGTWELELWVCREASDDAEAYAHGYERVLRTGQWQNYAGAYLNRITGIDTEAPLPAGRDASGRYLWKVTVYVSAARSIV